MLPELPEFACALRGDNEVSYAQLARLNARGQDRSHLVDLSVQGEFAHDEYIVSAFWDRTCCAKNAHGDRQVVRSAFLGQVCRGQIYKDSILWKFETAVPDSGSHSFP
jgi:hypothetical protein